MEVADNQDISSPEQLPFYLGANRTSLWRRALLRKLCSISENGN